VRKEEEVSESRKKRDESIKPRKAQGLSKARKVTMFNSCVKRVNIVTNG